MRRTTLLNGALIILGLGVGIYRAAFGYGPVANPDPNHTHADFAVWVNGEQQDFSHPSYMSGVSTDESTHPHEGLRQYLHLHDGNGHVIHRHKPGLTLYDFFGSLSMAFTDDGVCYLSDEPLADFVKCSEHGKFRMFVNGVERTPFELKYAFADLDRIVITDAPDGPELQKELASVTEDACKYSKTCPWRGEPPTENCIADPTVPCVVQ